MNKKQYFLLLITGMLALNAIALYNGFALTESDTGTYINNALYGGLSPDRSPFYGIFIRHSSLRTSFWYTLFAQALIVTFLLIRFIRAMLGTFPGFRLAIIILATLTAFTCVSWTVSELMPDVFSGILLLTIILFLTNPAADKFNGVLYGAIIFGATIIHNSHLPIMILFASFVVIYALVSKNKLILVRGLVLLTLPFLFWLIVGIANNRRGNGFTFSKTSHVFMMARLSQMGILKEYLDDNCARKNLKICACRNDLPAFTWDYMWGAQSPLTKVGGLDSAKTEDEQIIHDILTTPRYLIKFLQKSVTGTVRQLSKIGIADKTYQPSVLTSSPYWHIGAFIPNEAGEYQIAQQNTIGLDGSISNTIFYLFFFATGVWILFHAQNLTRQHRFIYLLILVFFLVNAGITSTLSTVHCRFMNRVFWILPATNSIIMIGYYWQKMEQKMFGA